MDVPQSIFLLSRLLPELEDELVSPIMGEKSMDGLNSCMERGARGVNPPPAKTKRDKQIKNLGQFSK